MNKDLFISMKGNVMTCEVLYLCEWTTCALSDHREENQIMKMLLTTSICLLYDCFLPVLQVHASVSQTK